MDITKSSFLGAANKFADKEHRKGLWEVWPKYETKPQKGGGRYILAVEPDESDLPPRVDLQKVLEKTNGKVVAGSREDRLVRQELSLRASARSIGMYWPLVDKPDLFLKFARLADDSGLDNAATIVELDTDKNEAAALNWAEGYGVLGLTPVEQDGLRGASTRGGRADTVAAFAYEAWVANGCLRLYEAATAKELDADLIVSYMGNPRHKSLYTFTPALTREWALDSVARVTQEKVAGSAYPALYGEVGRFVQGWSFTNLLGAMWLQMFWLLTATETPRRCRNWECDKIIAFEQPDQPKKGTKPKQFCNEKCRNRHTYLTVTKPRRLAAREL